MRLLIILFALVPCLSFSQMSESQRMEHAYFQVSKEGKAAFYTKIHSDESFSKGEYHSLEAKMLEKEGVFNVKLFDQGKTVVVYHFSFIEPETLKEFVYLVRDEFEIEEKTPYTFSNN